jgi:hypothetical protein
MLLFRNCSTVIRGAPRHVANDPTGSLDCSRCSQNCCQCSHEYPKLSPAHHSVLKPITITPMILLYHLFEITGTQKDSSDAHPGFDTLRTLTYLSLHSPSSQTLVQASSDYNTLSWCRDHVAFSFDSIGTLYLNYEFLQLTSTQVTQNGRGSIVDAAFTLIFWIGKGAPIDTCCLYGHPKHPKRTMLYQS